MKLDLFRTLWGVQAEVSSYAEELRQNGFVGVEARIPLEKDGRKKFAAALKQNQLDYIAVLFSGGDVVPDQSEGVQQHLARLDDMIQKAQELEPRFINVLPGIDRWSMSELVDFFGQAQAISEKHGIVCSFETHRATSLYSPWVTLELIRQLPDLRFTTDISHWVVVAERLLNHPVDDLTPFIDRVYHIQARVGYPQGPQVPHPEAPEYADALAFHQGVWEKIWLKHIAEGREISTMTTEFGPDGYLHHLPFTDVPVADLWSLNTVMAKIERKHFDQFIAKQN